jgi:pyridoxal phosphate enzyme (YggS family)
MIDQVGLGELKEELGAAELVAVTKSTSVENLESLYQFGQRHFGENRVDQLLERSELLKDSLPSLNWHFIGHLQSNKLAKLMSIENLYSIHSIDSLKLLTKLLKSLRERMANGLAPVKFFLQINPGGEEQKQGFGSYEQLSECVRLFASEPIFRENLAGLMAMAPIRTDDKDADAKACFQQASSLAQQLRDDFDLGEMELSMGMSGDYKIAIEQGSNWVRIGSALFR